MYTVERYHDISCGHRVCGHESKCKHLHGHNYRIHFVCIPAHDALDEIGRVVDFSVVKIRLCAWLERAWDHKFLIYEKDPLLPKLQATHPIVTNSLVVVPFNPTAENMAEYLVKYVGPLQLGGAGVVLHTVRIDETRKCAASYTRAV